MIILILLLPNALGAQGKDDPKKADASFKELPAPFFQSHCIKCHGAEKPAGKFRIDDLDADVGKDIDRWLQIQDQLREGAMPPPEAPQPDKLQTQKVITWITRQTLHRAAKLPNQGNLIPHELLFGKGAPASTPGPARLWRLSPDGYFGFLESMNRGKPAGIVQPFTLVPERGIKDYAGLYSIDEPSTEILLRNAEILVEAMTAHEIKDGKLQGKNNSLREFVALMDPMVEPTQKQLESAVQKMFQLALARLPDTEDLPRYLALYEKCAKLGNRQGAVKTMLQAVLLRTDAMFRTELGKGKEAGAGKRMLSQQELALALSFTLTERRDSGLMNAAAKGELTSPEKIAVHVRRILDDARPERPVGLRFLQEYFEYRKALDIFKERPRGFVHDARVLVSDTDRLILHILKEDRGVLNRLLTTEETYVNYSWNKNRKEGPKPAIVLNPVNNKGQKAPDHVYGFDAWPREQPAKVPGGKRLGILMQPSWLVAHATNFDNDPVRRGRWIRERLLGGLVPDLPIGVAAQVPDDKHRTFRDRLSVTREAQCWKCHRYMDELGLPFEQFDHYGVHRTTESVLDVEATAKNVDKKGKPLGPVERQADLDTTGKVALTGDGELDGPIKTPHELVQRLAKSDRVRQVFVRHAFRFLMGRNETLSDAKTLQDADRAYVKSGGSFKALVVSLLTSDTFLYRSTQIEARLKGDDR